MTVIGTVASTWRYPVKSMRGEQADEIFAGYAGVYGDRLYAFTSPGGPAVFPYLTGRENAKMLLHTPRFRAGAASLAPPLAAQSIGLGMGLTPLYGSGDELAIDVTTPDGEVFAIDDPELVERLGGGALELLRSERPLTDCRPVTLLSLQSVAAIAEASGVAPDPRRYRANIVADLAGSAAFAEDELLGRTLRIGERTTITLVERDPRCKMITLDPDTAEAVPAVLEYVTRERDSRAGVYAAVLAEGVVRPGDAIELLD
ncbi:MAG: MOSC domain-containing protein [Dehalococcoidia bacterium]|nr:MOSC domain-containing protein [Dehalococcoidia bacterium]